MLSENNHLLESQIKLWREQIKPSLTKALEFSPDDKLNWAPAPKMITLGNIFLHISECSDWWYDEVMNHRKSKELTPAPDNPVPSKPHIAMHLDSHWERLERFFAEKPEVLKMTYNIAGHERTRHFDGYWVFSHLLEHDIHHRSQINQYLRILGITPPEI
jgi:uncharacterized damage-inducible protein DinB